MIKIFLVGAIVCCAVYMPGCASRQDPAVHAKSTKIESVGGNKQPPSESACQVKSDTVIARNAVGPSWIRWKTPCLPDADPVYVDPETWDIWVMDETGKHKRCLTCYNNNILGLNFPLDDDGRSPAIHWKGDPEAHPIQPVIFCGKCGRNEDGR
jgi:hypothetical protein